MAACLFPVTAYLVHPLLLLCTLNSPFTLKANQTASGHWGPLCVGIMDGTAGLTDTGLNLMGQVRASACIDAVYNVAAVAIMTR